MKTASTLLKNFLLNSFNFTCFDLYTITLKNGTVLKLTSADVPVTYNGDVYSNAIPITRDATDTKTGINVDQLNVSLYPKKTDLINGVSYQKSFKNGTFDGSIMQIDKGFFINVSDMFMDFSQSLTYDQYGNTIVLFGTPTLSAGRCVLDGSSGIRTWNSNLLGTGQWIIFGKINLTANNPQYSYIFNASDSVLLYFEGTLIPKYQFNSSSGSITSGVLNKTLSLNKDYDYRVYFTGGTYCIDLSEDGGYTWKNYVTFASTTSVKNATGIGFGVHYSSAATPHSLIGSMTNIGFTRGSIKPTRQVVDIVPKWFFGQMEIDEVSKTVISVKINSMTQLLNIKIPRNLFQSSCPWILFDSNTCKVNKTNYTYNGVTTSTSTILNISCNLSNPDGFFDQGVITFTSGSNTNISRTVKAYTKGNILINSPLHFVPAAGDTFTISVGCNGTMSTCLSKFNNLDNFGGQPFVPPPDGTY